jgi:hypothetical protein
MAAVTKRDKLNIYIFLPAFKTYVYIYIYIYIYIYVCVCLCVCVYRVSQEECARLRENVPYVKVHRYNPKHLRVYPKLNGYGDNGQKKSVVFLQFHKLYLLSRRVTRTLRMSVLESEMQSTVRLPCKVLGTLRTTTALVRVFM